MSTRKIGAAGRELLERLREAQSPPTTSVSMLLRGRDAFSPAELKTLADDGARVRTHAGDIISADVPVDAIERVLAHDFVVSCELSRPLYFDKDANDDDARSSKGDAE
ncbi:MAG TPA: hypothetical protein VH740_10205 [Vicinamibacterales bacterium]|jgi:hypothetical protein